MRLRRIAVVGMLLLLSACSGHTAGVEIAEDNGAIIHVSTTETKPPVEPSPSPNTTVEPPIVENQWTEEEVEAMALTLAGECYDDKEQDKRLVCEVILNRVSDGGFGKSICDVVTAKHQFEGYWQQSRPVSENDIQVVKQTLEDWFENDCKALSEYLFFCAGENRENDFRVNFAD